MTEGTERVKWNKHDYTLMGIAVFVALSVIGILQWSRSDLDLTPMCVAGDNEICPPAKWMKMYDRVTAEGALLRSGVPGGYTFNDQTKKFVKLPPQPVPPAAVPPAAAPVPPAPTPKPTLPIKPPVKGGPHSGLLPQWDSDPDWQSDLYVLVMSQQKH